MRGPGSSGKGHRSPVAGLLVAGTTSDAGKSFVTTGLCRLLSRRGWRVAPFKAMNMSLNSVATDQGEEIALAQWVQCVAAGVPPTAAANPVLLKPYDSGVEIVLHGRPATRLRSWRREMPAQLPRLRAEIARAIAAARGSGRLVIAEGAGSPVELNLRSSDLANFFVAERLDAPVILVADLERGGALAQVVGTFELLRPSERARVCGIIFNRIRGDEQIFRPAAAWTEDRLGVPVLGVLPPLPVEAGALPSEDSLGLARRRADPPRRGGVPRLGVVRLPHTANFTDIEPLEALPDLDTRWIVSTSELAGCAAVLLPGTRRTGDDLAWLRRGGWPAALRRARSRGAGIGGVCGGFQILGEWLDDPEGVDGPPGRHRGLGLLPLTTRFQEPKIVRTVIARARPGHPWLPAGSRVSGYEIHRGRIDRASDARPIFGVTAGTGGEGSEQLDGVRSEDGRVWGTMLHGVLGAPESVEGLIRWVRSGSPSEYRTPGSIGRTEPESLFPGLDRTIDAVADLLERHLDLRTLERVLSARTASVTRRGSARPARSPGTDTGRPTGRGRPARRAVRERPSPGSRAPVAAGTHARTPR